MSSNALDCFMSTKYTFNLKECQCLSRNASYFLIAFLPPPPPTFQLSRMLSGVHVIWRGCPGIILTEVLSTNASFHLCSRPCTGHCGMDLRTFPQENPCQREKAAFSVVRVNVFSVGIPSHLLPALVPPSSFLDNFNFLVGDVFFKATRTVHLVTSTARKPNYTSL